MSEGKHTPGPWTVGEDDSMLGFSFIPVEYNDLGAKVCEVYPTVADNLSDDDRANARLIAAAPDMLEALNDLLTRPTDGSARARARVALAKAEGRGP